MANNNHGLGRGLASLIPQRKKNVIQPISRKEDAGEKEFLNQPAPVAVPTAAAVAG